MWKYVNKLGKGANIFHGTVCLLFLKGRQCSFVKIIHSSLLCRLLLTDIKETKKKGPNRHLPSSSKPVLGNQESTWAKIHEFKEICRNKGKLLKPHPSSAGICGKGQVLHSQSRIHCFSVYHPAFKCIHFQSLLCSSAQLCQFK